MIELSKEKKKEMDRAVEKALKHPYWKSQFEDAPSEECKDYLRFTYYFSECYDPEAEDAELFDKIQEYAERKLSAEDWRYLRGMAPNSPFAGYCEQKIKELS